MAEWVCALAFDSKDPEFLRGFEAGHIYGELTAKPDEPLLVHVLASNSEMMLRIAEATGRPFKARELEEPVGNQPRLEITFEAV